MNAMPHSELAERVADMLAADGHSTPSGDGWRMTTCPCHDDRQKSLAVREGDRAALVFKCHAGCDPKDVFAAVKARMTGLEPPRKTVNSGDTGFAQKKPVAYYDYRDATGALIFQVVRYDNPKTFRQRQPNTDKPGDWIWTMNGVERQLYRLQEILSAPLDTPIWFVEGEKDVETLRAAGMVATTKAGGAKSTWYPQYGECLRDRNVYVIPDNDAAGEGQLQVIRDNLAGVAASVITVRLPEGSKDVTDWWIHCSGTRAKLEALSRHDDLIQPAHPLVALAPAPPPAAAEVHQLRPGYGKALVTPWYQRSWAGRIIAPTNKGQGVGEPTKTFLNAVVPLQHDPLWSGLACIDSMSGMLRIGRDAPELGFKQWDAWSEQVTLKYMAWLHAQGILLEKTAVDAAAIHVGYENERHPVREWLESLPAWDGVDRIDTFLHKHAGAESSHYVRCCSKIIFLSMVARALNPGCLVRTVVVLEGAQNIGKSSIIGSLVPDRRWFYEGKIDMDDDKRTPMLLNSCWVAEMAELAQISKHSVETVKEFISRREDKYIPLYGKHMREQKRGFIFVGSVNGDQYLVDATGNTRFLIVPVMKHKGATSFDVDGFAAQREQFFAEALQRIRAGEKHWIDEDDEFTKIARRIAESREAEDAWEDKIAKYLHGRDGFVFSEDLLNDALGLVSRDATVSVTRRLGSIMKRFGFKPDRRRRASMGPAASALRGWIRDKDKFPVPPSDDADTVDDTKPAGW